MAPNKPARSQPTPAPKRRGPNKTTSGGVSTDERMTDDQEAMILIPTTPKRKGGSKGKG